MKAPRIVAMLLLLTPVFYAQQQEPFANLLARFDGEHDLAKKESLLRDITDRGGGAGPPLLQLANSTKNTDTRWMAMRGMATLHYVEAAPFLQECLKDPEWTVRANAARALGDLRIKNAASGLIAMFAVEEEPGALQQASLALRLLDVKAAAPYIRQKVPQHPGQTRVWLLQALGGLGSAMDVPLIAGYLDGSAPEAGAAADAIQELTGVDFGPRRMGLQGYPTPVILAARAWWSSHKVDWPHCADCRFQ
jgi:hypothetical protein